MMLFLPEHKKFISENAFGIRNEELTKKLNKQFKTSFTVGQVRKYKHSHHIDSGLRSCNLPVGSERVSKGYILVKVKEPNIWKEKHRIIYELVHGKIPKGYKIMFLDGNKKNCNIENLELVTDNEELYINNMGFSGINKEFTETAINLARSRSKVIK